MILLTEVSEIEEFYRIKLLFEQKGILAHYGNQDSARTYGVFHPVGKYAIYIMMDEQFEDAKQLLIDESHIAENPIHVSEVEQASHKSMANKKIINTLFYIVLILILVLFFLFN